MSLTRRVHGCELHADVGVEGEVEEDAGDEALTGQAAATGAVAQVLKAINEYTCNFMLLLRQIRKGVSKK